MTRFAMLAVLAALPFAVVAAPVPDAAPKPFGTSGLVARAELEALKFDSRAVPAAEQTRGRIKRAIDIEKKALATEDDDAPPKVRPANRYDVGVHMPAVRFLVGDPIVAYFVVRNNRDDELDLDGRLEFAAGAPVANNNCDLRLTDARTGKPVARELVKAIKCGGSELLLIPADGFYCAKGDLGPLPAGEYDVDWRCGEFRSAPVRFRVFDRDGPPRPAAARAARDSLFFHLADDYQRERKELDRPRDEPVSRFVALDAVEAREVDAALASGSASDSLAFVPDARDIPSRDAHVLVSVDWYPYRSGDRITVTLRAAPPFDTVRFAELPHLYLQADVSGRADRAREVHAAVSKKIDVLVHYTTPLTIEAHFPEDWRAALGSGETARVAVVVTARELQWPDGAKRAFEKVKFAGNAECPTWAGVLRSEFAELRLPPPAP